MHNFHLPNRHAQAIINTAQAGKGALWRLIGVINEIKGLQFVT